jgi:hypothetical protein
MSDTGHWSAQGLNLDPVKAVGFVYMIIDLDTNQKYIGKKNFTGRGKLNKGEPSNWKSYSSSSKYVQQMISEKGEDRFKFIILEQYFTVGGLTFAETWSQIVCETPCNNDEFLNRFIDKITFKVTEPVSLHHRNRLKYYLRKYKYEKTAKPVEPASDD